LTRARPPVAIEAGATLDSLFDQAELGLALWDTELRFLRVSPALARINGRTVEEHIGRPLAEVLPEIPREVLDACARVIETGEPVTGLRVEGPHAAGGALRTFTCSYYPVREAGAVIGLWGSVTETTAERVAREATGILREVIARAPTPMAVMWGEELVFSHVNERASELLPDGELLGLRADEVFPQGEELAADLRAAVLGRRETLAVHEVPLGDRIWTFACVPLPGDDDRPGGVLAVGQEVTGEVTRRRALEAELADEHRIATQLQVSLMPDRLPEVPGMDLASGFLPAGEGHEIGGDFYDVFEVSDGCWMVVIGDVCGKGAEAAALTALARYTLRAAAIQEGAEPAELLAQLNEAILRQRHDMRFLSAVCAFLDLDPDGGARVRVCVAGHVPPLLVNDGGEVSPVPGGTGPVLGVWDELELTSERIRLNAGQRLVLYTDGVLDAQHSDELTERGLAHLLGGFTAETSADTVREIERAVLGDAGGVGRDDIAVLVLRPLP
jgi:PAS domain S-box-containing protein